MKWTKETKEKALKMLKMGMKDNEIAPMVGMSIYSLSSLRYSEVIVNSETVKCEICNQSMKQITPSHLKNKHSITVKKYHEMFPNSSTSTPSRIQKYKNFKNPNRGKTYNEIYGEEESKIKRNKISKKQIGRKCAVLAGTGITGTRKDTKTFARSTYEANVDRIFIYEHKRYADEFTPPNRRFELKGTNDIMTYQPDRVDIDGLFCKNSFIEVKGYMYPEDWVKINLFREQYKDKQLIVISDDLKFSNILYKELEKKYKPLIPLWEDDYQNYKNRPDLYKIDYQPDEVTKYFNDNFKNQIHNSITDNHKIFIAEKCINYNKVSMGKKVYIISIDLISISNKRMGAYRSSSGVYNYELWKIKTKEENIFYITNTTKTTIFYCYEQSDFEKINKFFDNNCDRSLQYGKKQEWEPAFINKDTWQKSNDREKYILKMCNDKLKHSGKIELIYSVSLNRSKETKRGAKFNFEEWNIITKDPNNKEKKYILTNFGHSTSEYVLNPI